jgi:hypothetical protein
MNFKTSSLFVALVAFALLFVTNVAQAGGRPIPEWQCARKLRDAQAASSAQVCRIAGPSRFESTGYGDWRREICNIRCDLVATLPPARVVVQPVPNLPPEWLQRAAALRNDTDTLERIETAVAALTVKIDRIEAAQRAQASASRTSTTTRTTTTTSTATPSSRQELESAWASCKLIEEALRTDASKASIREKCIDIGVRLGVR